MRFLDSLIHCAEHVLDDDSCLMTTGLLDNDELTMRWIEEDRSTVRSWWHGQLSVECFLGSSITLYLVVHEPFWLSRSAQIHVLHHTRAGMSRRNRDRWSRSAPSWYQKDWNPTVSGGDKASKGYTDWSGRDTRGTSRRAVRRTTPRHGKRPRNISYKLRRPSAGSCRKY